MAVDTQPLVGVIGASGSGKSSLVFAGLVPHLRTTGKVEIVSFRPGKNPFDALTVALSSHIRSTIIVTQGNNPNPLEISNECASPTQINLLHDEKALCRLIENIVASGQISPQSSFSWLGGGLLAVSAATGFTAWNWVNAEIKSTRERLNSSILTSENYLDLGNYSDALFKAIKNQQFLDDSWWKSQVPSEIQKKIQIVINQQTHSFIEAKHTIKGHKNGVWSVVFSPDGKTIASASLDGTVKLWDAQNHQLIHTLEGHKNEVWSVVFSPNGKIIASASIDKTVKLWDAQNRKLIHTLKGHKNSLRSVVFSPDGKTVASASLDGIVKS